MSKRKIFLLAANAVLLCVCIVQFIVKAQSHVKVFSIKGDIDCIEITKSDGSFSIVKNDDKWIAGEKQYPANSNTVKTMLDAVSSINALDRVASTSGASGIEKYELTDAQKITVTAKRKDKILRTVIIGKNASAGTQCYAVFDKSNDIYLVSGNLRSVFSKTVSEIREMAVIKENAEDVESVEAVLSSGKNVKLTRESQIEGFTQEQVVQTLENYSSLSATKWYDSKINLGGELIASVKINLKDKAITLDVYKIPAADENSTDVYYADCSESPYTFEFAGYAGQRFEILSKIK
ncbi:MAG: DUF4340 domain-containing protein [Treponema sp.]|nr:DUF4340 domain-containing protein [Treponema sp.]